ncbi:MAG: type III-B CRISPR module-associated protein Cmr3 [Bryobacterales bacterium]|nr:type III-B CRISPR module-associated protein Cmr3 [Bryobacterales bacterium]
MRQSTDNRGGFLLRRSILPLELRVTPRDPIIARDGRPFGSGQANRMRTLSWPLPQTLAGSFRTLLGKHAGGFNDEVITKLLSIPVHGPLPLHNDNLYLPRPFDLVASEVAAYRSRPNPNPAPGASTNSPALLSCVTALPPDLDHQFKPIYLPPFVSLPWMTKWLLEAPLPDSAFLPAPPIETRTHASLNADTGAAEDHLLYTTEGLACPEGLQMICRTDPSPLIEVNGAINQLHPLGGERRLAHWLTGTLCNARWSCPLDIRQALSTSRHIRLVLATPGMFSAGWLPGWLANNKFVPGTRVRLRLISACVERWQAISGWNLRRGSEFGPKAIRRLVPSGSVYFCELVEPESTADAAGQLAAHWLQSVSDSDQDANDGFGLALWGIWSDHHA